MKLSDNQEYTQQHFSNLSEEKKKYSHCEFDRCIFDNCFLLECTFQDCSFTNCTFTNCDISALKVTNSNFTDVTFAHSKVIGIDWTKAGKVGSSLPLSIHFKDSTITYSHFFGLNLTGIQMTNCVVHEVDFVDAIMINANCTKSDFSQSTFLNTNLTRADFRESINYAIDPRANLVKKAKFSTPEALSLLRGFDIVIE